MKSIYNIITEQEDRLLKGQPIKIGKYATHNHAEKIATIQAYMNSQHISGKYDSKEREKPFFNIVTQAVNVWYKATDIDRKQIKFRPTKASQRIKTFIATIRLRNWMRENDFGLWLNKWGYTLAAFGSAVTKFVEKGGKLIPTVISWDRMICDPVEFNASPIVEKIYYTLDELRNSNYDSKAVDSVLASIEKGGDTRTTLSDEPVDMSDEYIGVYELHGELPLYYLTDKDKDKKIYQQQMHTVFIHKGKTKKENTEITLYRGKEKNNPYYLSDLIGQDCRTLSIGAVESLLDPQWMVNNSMKAAKDQLELASKTLLQTSDAQFTGRNVIKDVDTGDILVTDDQKPLVPINTQASAVPFLMEYMKQWYEVGKDISGASESMTGQNMPAGTPYRLGAILNIESHNLFEIMKQSKGLHLEKMLRKYVLPYFKKTLNSIDEVVVSLEGEELEQFDKLALPAQLAIELQNRLGTGEGNLPDFEDMNSIIQEKNVLMGDKRALKLGKNASTWKEYFSDLDLDAIEVEITGENRNKAEAFSIMNGILQLLIQSPNALDNPNVRKLLSKIMDEAGYVLPFEFLQGNDSAQGPQQQPVGGTTPSMAGLSQLAGQSSAIPGVDALRGSSNK